MTNAIIAVCNRFADFSGAVAPSTLAGWANTNEELLQPHHVAKVKPADVREGDQHREHYSFPDPGFIVGSHSWQRYMYVLQWRYLSEDVIKYLSAHSNEIIACGEKRSKLWPLVLTLPL